MRESRGGARRQKANEAKKEHEVGNSDATSKETLTDVQENEEESGSGAGDNDGGPTPDGAFDEPGEIKDAGPM